MFVLDDPSLDVSLIDPGLVHFAGKTKRLPSSEEFYESQTRLTVPILFHSVLVVVCISVIFVVVLLEGEEKKRKSFL